MIRLVLLLAWLAAPALAQDAEADPLAGLAQEIQLMIGQIDTTIEDLRDRLVETPDDALLQRVLDGHLEQKAALEASLARLQALGAGD